MSSQLSSDSLPNAAAHSMSLAQSRSPVGTVEGGRSRRQGIFWLLTVPHYGIWPQWTVELPVPLSWIRGQLEQGAETGYKHWQVCCAFRKKIAITGVVGLFGTGCHAELSRSESASEYVWKEETRVAGTQFELGIKPFRRNSATDWDVVWTAAQSGNLDLVNPQLRVVHYRSLRQIGSDYAVPVCMERTCVVYWGSTGVGKSRRAWDEAGLDSYPKDPRTKFWCGYQNQQHVVIDEFRGGIDVAHLLRWLDRYPVRVEIKGSSRPLVAIKFWITSNLEPKDWYPDVDYLTQEALLRRLEIVHLE